MNSQIKIWTFFGIINIKTDSKLIQRLFNVYVLIFSMLFIYIGCFIQTLWILKAINIRELVETLFISIAYINAALKFAILSSKRSGIQELWNKLDANEFKIVDSDEYK